MTLYWNGVKDRKGTSVKELTAEERNNIGYMLILDEPYMNESLWFIPEDSIAFRYAWYALAVMCVLVYLQHRPTLRIIEERNRYQQNRSALLSDE